jgi:hypothetical protein
MHYLDYNEKKQHGTPDFPIEYYHVDEHHPRYNMPFHCHKELEIIRILEGILYLKLDDEEFEAKAGDIIFINEGVIHGGLPHNCIYECIVFDIQRLLMHRYLSVLYPPYYKASDYRTESFYKKQPFPASNYRTSFHIHAA